MVWALVKSESVTEVLCAPGNGGIAAIATCIPIDASNIVELADVAEKLNVDLTVVGPELPLALGIVDKFQSRGLTVFGATLAAAEIESSKAFAKNFMRAHDIPTARFEVCGTQEEARARVAAAPFGYPMVIKADGLAAGKGVFMVADEAEALAAVDRLMKERVFGNAGDRVVLEEFLEGTEVSFLVVTDGKHVVPLASAQDYKRAEDGDRGPNTGGMGSFSPSRALTAESSRAVLEKIIYPTLRGLASDGRTFSGFLYAGLMLTGDEPKVLEYNARFGDPEAQSIIPRLVGDLGEILMAAAEGKLGDKKFKWRKEVAVSVVLTSEGYPGSVQTGRRLTGLEAAERMEGVSLFHAGTRLDADELVTSAGRVLTVTAMARSLAAAREQAYKAVAKIEFEGMRYRRDIGLVEPST